MRNEIPFPSLKTTMESHATLCEPEGRWLDTYKLLERPGPLAGEAFEPDTPDAPKVGTSLLL